MTEGMQLPRFESMLIIEDDVPVATSLARLLTGSGICSAPDMAHNGKDAWTLVTRKTIEFIVLDWKLPGLSGLAILNKLRQTPKTRDIPVLINSGFLRRPDTTLLAEFPFVELAAKPTNSARLIAQIAQLKEFQNEYVRFTEPVDRWRSSSPEEKQKTLGQLLNTMSLNNWDDDSMQKKALCVKLVHAMLEAGFAKEAIQLVQPLLEKNNTNLFYMTLLGKVFLSQRDFKNALTLLGNAQKTSQENLDRTQFLGECYLQLCNFPEAQNCYKAIARHGLAGSRLAMGQFLADVLPQSLPKKPFNIPINLAGFCSLALISLVKSGLTKEAIDMYEAASAFLPDPFIKSNFAYNIGLGFFHSKPGEAYKWFKLSYDLSGGKFGRARDYANQLAGDAGAQKINGEGGTPSLSLYQFDGDNFAIVGTKKAS